MKRQEIEARVVKVAAEVLRIPPERIRMESRFKEDLSADSLDLVTLLMALEEELHITIPDEREAGLLTVGDAVLFIVNHLKASP